MPDGPRLLTINEACALMHVTRKTIYNWINNGKVEYTRTPGGQVRIEEASLVAAVERMNEPPAPPPPAVPYEDPMGPLRDWLRGKSCPVCLQRIDDALDRDEDLLLSRGALVRHVHCVRPVRQWEGPIVRPKGDQD